MAFVTLIRPSLLVPKWSDSGPLTPPLGPAFLAASLRRGGHEVRIIDGVGECHRQTTGLFDNRMIGIGLTSEQIVEHIDPATTVIGVSSMFSQDWPEVRRAIRLVHERFPQVPIIVGGEHVSAVPTFTLESCPQVDHCVIGEGEETIVELVDALDNNKPVENIAGLNYRDSFGCIHQTPPRARIRDVNQIPLPAWDLVPISNYLDHGLGFGVHRGRSMPILATRGCPYQCTFCSSPQMFGTRWVARTPSHVLDEIESYMQSYAATNFDFYDLTAIIKRDWIIEFCNMILERGLSITWQLPSGTRSEAIDDEVTKLLYQSGCRNISYAPESGSAGMLRRIKKRIRLDKMRQSIQSAVRNGLNLKLNVIMGFPDETRRDVWLTILFLARMGATGVHDASVSLFSPYPGSELYDQLRKSGAIPALSDEYFLSLGTYKDFAQTASYTQGIGARELHAYRLMGMLTFYATQYAVRPWRFWRTIRNFLACREESRLDKSLRDWVRRMFPNRGVDVAAHTPHIT